MKQHRCAMLACAAVVGLAAAALAAEDSETVKGHIQKIDPSAHQVQVVTDEGAELTLRVDEGSRLRQHGREVRLDEFRKGMAVKVRFQSRDGERRVVSMRPAAVSAEEVRNEIRDAIRAAKSYSYQHRDEYRERLQRALEEANERIGQLQEQAAHAGAEAKKRYAPQIEELRRLRDKAQAQAERVQAATPAAWEHLKSGVMSAFEDLRRAFDKSDEPSK